MKKHTCFANRVFFRWMIVSVFLMANLCPFVPDNARAQVYLPDVSQKLSVTGDVSSVVLKGIKVSRDNPWEMDFIVDRASSEVSSDHLKEEITAEVRYFLAALTMPDESLWVNLSPYEKDRIIDAELALTEMGRDMLAQDYVLKQMTSSLMDPETDVGAGFWERIYQRAYEELGVTDIPMETFHKIWIVPGKARIYQKDDEAYVVESSLKLMLEKDYLAEREFNNRVDLPAKDSLTPQQILSQDTIKEKILPLIAQEVNYGEHFVPLRKIYHALILATWFKKQFRGSVLERSFANRKAIQGIDLSDEATKDKIYQQYVQAFKTGVFNYLKEEYDPVTQQIVPRKYFSGGMALQTVREDIQVNARLDEVNLDSAMMVKVRLIPQSLTIALRIGAVAVFMLMSKLSVFGQTTVFKPVFDSLGYDLRTREGVGLERATRYPFYKEGILEGWIDVFPDGKFWLRNRRNETLQVSLRGGRVNYEWSTGSGAALFNPSSGFFIADLRPMLVNGFFTPQEEKQLRDSYGRFVDSLKDFFELNNLRLVETNPETNAFNLKNFTTTFYRIADPMGKGLGSLYVAFKTVAGEPAFFVASVQRAGSREFLHHREDRSPFWSESNEGRYYKDPTILRDDLRFVFREDIAESGKFIELNGKPDSIREVLSRAILSRLAGSEAPESDQPPVADTLLLGASDVHVTLGSRTLAEKRPDHYDVHFQANGRVSQMFTVKDLTIVGDHSGSLPLLEVQKINAAFGIFLHDVPYEGPLKFVDVSPDAVVRTLPSKSALQAGLPKTAGQGATFVYRSLDKAVKSTGQGGFVLVFTDGRSDIEPNKIGDEEPDRDVLWEEIDRLVREKKLRVVVIGTKDSNQGTFKDRVSRHPDMTFVYVQENQDVSDAFQGVARSLSVPSGISVDLTPRGVAQSVGLYSQGGEEFLADQMGKSSEFPSFSEARIVDGDLSLDPSSGMWIGNPVVELSDGTRMPLVNANGLKVSLDLQPQIFPITVDTSALSQDVYFIVDLSSSMTSTVDALTEAMVGLTERYDLTLKGIGLFGGGGTSFDFVNFSRDKLVKGWTDFLDARRPRIAVKSRGGQASTPGWASMRESLTRIADAPVEKPTKIILATDGIFYDDKGLSKADRDLIVLDFLKLVAKIKEKGIEIILVSNNQEFFNIKSKMVESIAAGTFRPITSAQEESLLHASLATGGKLVYFDPTRPTRDPFLRLDDAFVNPFSAQDLLSRPVMRGFYMWFKDDVGNDHRVFVPLSEARPVSEWNISDRAMMEIDNADKTPVGGIDFNPSSIDLEVSGESRADASMRSSSSQYIPLKGLVPVVVDIHPFTSGS